MSLRLKQPYQNEEASKCHLPADKTLNRDHRRNELYSLMGVSILWQRTMLIISRQVSKMLLATHLNMSKHLPGVHKGLKRTSTPSLLVLLQDTGWELPGLSLIVTKDTESHVSLPYCSLAYEHIRGQFTELIRTWLIKIDLQVMISYKLGNQDSHWETGKFHTWVTWVVYFQYV